MEHRPAKKSIFMTFAMALSKNHVNEAVGPLNVVPSNGQSAKLGSQAYVIHRNSFSNNLIFFFSFYKYIK